jgi:hypothetical protein
MSEKLIPLPSPHQLISLEEASGNAHWNRITGLVTCFRYWRSEFVRKALVTIRVATSHFMLDVAPSS